MEEVRSLKSSYRSRRDNLPKDFFIPCLRNCKLYKRAVGYFTSTSLGDWIGALDNLVLANDTRIQMIIAPIMDPADKVAVEGLMNDDNMKREYCSKIADSFIEEIIEASSASPLRNRSLLLWLIANDKLRLKFAFLDSDSEEGIYHEKLGVFYFRSDERVAFEGSANETSGGYKRNKEKICVFRDWVSEDIERVNDTERDFDSAWNNSEGGISVFEMSPSVLEKVKTNAPASRPVGPNQEQLDDKWKHQKIAFDRFLAEKSGILEMATGTGKTRTALTIAAYLYNHNHIDSIIITTDGIDLLSQWYEEVFDSNDKFEGLRAVNRQFGGHKQLMSFCLNPEKSILIVSRQDKLAVALRQLPRDFHPRTLIIHDEVHGMGSPSNVKDLAGLHERFIYKLGLSATPERIYDEEGSAFIRSSLGNVIYQFGLVEAIEAGILCEFDYFPIPYEISEDDRQRLRKVRAYAAARAAEGKPMSDSELYTKLAYVYKTALNKPPAFEEFVGKDPSCILNAILFVEDRAYGQRILPTLHRHTHKYRTYYAEDDAENLRKFSDGEIDCLMTCHKLSQGIDISKLEKVILFSSAAARLETIQRIGRCLRIDSSNPSKRAKVIDFVRIEDESENDDSEISNADTERRDWLQEISKTRRSESGN